MNNWLGFSLSPQEIPSHHHPHHHLSFNSHEINGVGAATTTTDECFDSTTLLPSLNLTPHAPPFGVVVLEEPFNNNNNNNHSQG